MGRSIVITSGKGGVGKTTATANIGTALAMMGKSVVVVDADIGLRNLDVVMGLDGRVVYTSMDVIEGVCDLEKALIRDKRSEHLKLLAASQRNEKTDVQPEQMKKLCDQLKEKYDYVLIDSPAGIEHGFKIASASAEEGLVVTTPEVAAIRDADRIIGLLQNMELSPLHLIINRLAIDMVKKGDMMNQRDILEILSIDLIGVVPRDKSIIISTNRGLPLTLIENSSAGEAFKRIAQRINGKEVPIPDLKEAGWLLKLPKKLFGRKEKKVRYQLLSDNPDMHSQPTFFSSGPSKDK